MMSAVVAASFSYALWPSALFLLSYCEITQGRWWGVYMARIFTFVDTEGVEIHNITDSEDKLPVPEATQVITIGESRMWVQSVTPQHTVHSPIVYRVSVRILPAARRLIM